MYIDNVSFLFTETAMGTRLNDETSKSAKTYKDSIYEIGKVLFERFCRVYLYPDFFYNMTNRKKRQDEFVDTIHNFTKKVIIDRKDYTQKHGEQFNVADDDFSIKKKRTAMLDLLISAEKNGEIDNRGIQEEVDTFMFEVSKFCIYKFVPNLRVVISARHLFISNLILYAILKYIINIIDEIFSNFEISTNLCLRKSSVSLECYKHTQSRKSSHMDIHTYIPLTLFPRRGSRGISNIPPRHPSFTKIS
jgi:hypothetical protein